MLLKSDLDLIVYKKKAHNKKNISARAEAAETFYTLGTLEGIFWN